MIYELNENLIKTVIENYKAKQQNNTPTINTFHRHNSNTWQCDGLRI